MLAFGRAQKTNDARGGPLQADDPKRYDALKRLLSASPAPGRNNAISSHGNPFFAVFGAPYLAEGEIAVVRARRQGRLRDRRQDQAGGLGRPEVAQSAARRPLNEISRISTATRWCVPSRERNCRFCAMKG